MILPMLCADLQMEMTIQIFYFYALEQIELQEILFGPLVGYKLKSLFSDADRINIIGDLSNTVNASNILDVSKKIRDNFKNPFIIAVDSAMSTQDNVGTINVAEGPLTLRNKLKQKMCRCW